MICAGDQHRWHGAVVFERDFREFGSSLRLCRKDLLGIRYTGPHHPEGPELISASFFPYRAQAVSTRHPFRIVRNDDLDPRPHIRRQPRVGPSSLSCMLD